MPDTTFQRDLMVRRLEQESFDVLIVGGGITGAGAALDATTRGLRTALIERDDLASGTSSKSSKLVHGGLRYLKDDPRLVYEALRERQRLRKNALHLVQVMPFMIPILTKDGVVSRKIARAMGSLMWMYDLTGGWRIGKFHKRLRAPAALAHMPTMHEQRLASAYLYYDAAADDARLVLTIAHGSGTRCSGRQSMHAGAAHQGCRRRRRRCHRRGRRPPVPGAGQGGGQRRRRVGRRRARSMRAPTPIPFARRRACTSPCRGRRCATTSPS